MVKGGGGAGGSYINNVLTRMFSAQGWALKQAKQAFCSLWKNNNNNNE